MATESQTGCDDPRFLADAMLGRLARWLRVLGYDTAYCAHIPDAELIQQAWREERIILTRDHALAKSTRPVKVLLIDSPAPSLQLRQVVRQFHLPWQAHLFRRCLRCNALLRPISPQEAVSHVPSVIFQQQQVFIRCSLCARTYWEGSHVTRMRQHLQHLFSEVLPTAERVEEVAIRNTSARQDLQR